MAVLNRSTLRRLQKLPQLPSVWEGDRRPLSGAAESMIDTEEVSKLTGECILWVDGSQGVVRAMDMVTPDTGPESVVRTLLRAMEHPQSPAPAGRPQKIVVKNREIQFFLRGILQELDISIEYVPNLPLIDEIFRGLQEVTGNRPPEIPPQFAQALKERAYNVWQDQPWVEIAEHQIIAVEVNRWDVETVYLSIMGRLGMDYGVIMYRSLESLKRFRQEVITQDDSFDSLEEAFLKQDCLFVTFDRADYLEDEDEDDEDVHLPDLPLSEIEPTFGNLHPLEGLRSILYDEEAAIAFVVLETLHRFWKAHRKKLQNATSFPKISSRYTISLVSNDGSKPESLTVNVATMPDLADELYEMAMAVSRSRHQFDEDEDEDEDDGKPVLNNHLVPENSLLSLGAVPWETVEYLRESAKFHQGADQEFPEAGDGLPIVMIQTTNPKAKVLIEQLQAAGGLKAICFNPGEDPFEECEYDLGILQTEDEELHLFGEFLEDDATHKAARKKWDRRCKNTKGWCGLIITRGATGASRGQPQFKDMMALFEVRFCSPKELGLGPLKLTPVFE